MQIPFAKLERQRATNANLGTNCCGGRAVSTIDRSRFFSLFQIYLPQCGLPGTTVNHQIPNQSFHFNCGTLSYFSPRFVRGPARGAASVLICMTVSGCSRSRFLAAKGRSHLSGPFSDDAGYGARMMNGGHTGIDWWNRNGPPGG